MTSAPVLGPNLSDRVLAFDQGDHDARKSVGVLEQTVWVGMSAGSMVMTPRIGEEFVGWQPPGGGDDRTLGLVDFSIFPHLDDEALPTNTMAAAEKWAGTIGVQVYAIDNETALKVTDGNVEVISDGHWRYFPSQPASN